MLKTIANNAEIDVIWEEYQTRLEPLREALNAALGEAWEEWQIPRDAGEGWTDAAIKAHADWWELRIARQKEIDKSIAKRPMKCFYDGLMRTIQKFVLLVLSPSKVFHPIASFLQTRKN